MRISFCKLNTPAMWTPRKERHPSSAELYKRTHVKTVPQQRHRYAKQVILGNLASRTFDHFLPTLIPRMRVSGDIET